MFIYIIYNSSLRTNLICGGRPTEALVVHQLGYAGVLSAHRAAGLLGPQLDGPESGILSIKHHQLLTAGSWNAWSRMSLLKSITAQLDSGRHASHSCVNTMATVRRFGGTTVQNVPG